MCIYNKNVNYTVHHSNLLKSINLSAMKTLNLPLKHNFQVGQNNNSMCLTIINVIYIPLLSIVLCNGWGALRV